MSHTTMSNTLKKSSSNKGSGDTVQKAEYVPVSGNCMRFSGGDDQDL